MSPVDCPEPGIVSEWLIYLASFRSAVGAQSGATAAAAIGAPALAFIGGLAVVCFVKAFSAVFLGLPRGGYEVDSLAETPASMRWPMGVLAASCVAVGLLPVAAGGASRAAAQALLPDPQTPLDAALPELAAATVLLLGVLAASAGIAIRLSARRFATFTWDCGYAAPTARMEYTASSFAQVLGRLFRRVLVAEVHEPRIEALFPRAESRFESHVPDPVLDRLLLPGVAQGQRGLRRARAIQTGHIQMYLVYIVVTLVALLAWSASR